MERYRCMSNPTLGSRYNPAGPDSTGFKETAVFDLKALHFEL